MSAGGKDPDEDWGARRHLEKACGAGRADGWIVLDAVRSGPYLCADPLTSVLSYIRAGSALYFLAHFPTPLRSTNQTTFLLPINA